MRVALFPSSYAPNPGGVEEVAARLARDLVAQGHQPIVVTQQWPAGLARRETIDGIDVIRLDFVAPASSLRAMVRFALRAPAALRGTMRTLRAHSTAVVHVHCVSTNALYALLAARLLRLPLVVTMHGELTGDADQIYQRSLLLPRLLRHLLRHADRVTAPSRQTLDDAETIMGVETGTRGSVVFNGVALEEFAGDDAEPDEPYLFAIGRHVDEKGFDLLLEAFAALETKELRLVIAGDGPRHEALVEQANQLGLGDRVSFPGRTDRETTAALFRGCRFFVLSSRAESFGIVNLEAMAAGKAIVATRVGGVPEIVENGVNGLVIPPESSSELTGAMRRLLDDPALTARLGAAGRAMTPNFGWPAITRRYVELYEAARAHRSPRIAWVSGETPDVDGHGGQRRAYAQIKALVQSGFSVSVVTAAGPQSDRSIAELAPVRRYRLSGWRVPAVRPIVRTLITGRAVRGADLVVVSNVESIEHLSARLLRWIRKPVVVDVTNIYSEYYEDPATRAEWRQLEDEVLGAAALSIALADDEAASLRARGLGDVVVWPNGIDPSEWSRSAAQAYGTPVLYFFGSLAYDVNVIGVEWFLTEVFPKLRAAVPDVRLRISGPGTPPESWAAIDGVELLGWVPSVLEVATGCAGIIMPIHRGPGTRVKFSEALATGLPVISTTFATRGSQVADRAIIADTPDEWTQRCLEVIGGEHDETAREARRVVLEIETWSATGQAAMQKLRGLVRGS